MDMVCNLDSAFAVLDQQILHAMDRLAPNFSLPLDRDVEVIPLALCGGLICYFAPGLLMLHCHTGCAVQWRCTASHR